MKGPDATYVPSWIPCRSRVEPFTPVRRQVTKLVLMDLTNIYSMSTVRQ